ncbi:MAG: hypothetical protein AAB847_01815 [Patescibacteria group bacterium]
MIGTTIKEIHIQREEKQIFSLHLFSEYAEDEEMIRALNEILPHLKRRNCPGTLKPGFYKKESANEKDITLILIK